MKRYGTRAADTSTWRGGNCRAKQIVSIVATVIAVAAAFLFLLSFSISLPIINRWFYYIQIDTLHLEQASGHTYAEIKAAYDEILDYLLLPGRQFGAGVFRFSEEGAAHFADCKFLFVLDLVIAGVSFGVICGIVALHFTKIITLKKTLTDAEEQNKNLKEEIKLYSTTQNLEGIARNTLKMAGEDEVLIIINNTDTKSDKKQKKKTEAKNAQ